MDGKKEIVQSALYDLFLATMKEKIDRNNPNRIKNKDIAALIGIAPESVSRYKTNTRKGSGTPAEELIVYLTRLGVPMFEIFKCMFKDLKDEEVRTMADVYEILLKGDSEAIEHVKSSVRLIKKFNKDIKMIE